MTDRFLCDIGMNMMQTAVGRAGDGGPVLSHECMRHYEQPLFKGSELVNPGELERLLISAPGYRRGMRAVFIVSDGLQATREVPIPHGALKKAGQIVELAAEEYLSGDIGGYTIDYRLFSGEDSAFALSAALPTALGTQLHGAAARAGLRLTGIDVPLNCAAKCVVQFQKAGETARPAGILADFTDAGTVMAAAEDGRLIHAAVIPGAMRSITADVAQQAGVDERRAVELMRTVDITNDGGASEYAGAVRALRDHLNSIARTMISELKPVLSRMRTSGADMLISGALSLVSGVGEYLQEMFAIYDVNVAPAPRPGASGRSMDENDPIASCVGLYGALL